MTIIGIDDTDSRTRGMCTTYIGHLIATDLKQSSYTVESTRLVRLNPAAKHKTRGNAAVAIITDASPETAMETAREHVFKNSATGDEETNPGIVIAEFDECPEEVQQFGTDAIHKLLDRSDAVDLINKYSLLSDHQGNGRGRIGALAAIGLYHTVSDWTYEHISYREEHTFGTEREVDYDSLFDVADEYYPQVWDTVDRTTGDPVAVPNTPCPILYGIRGDDKDAVVEASQAIESQTVDRSQTFLTNQGTDLHLKESSIKDAEEDSAYYITGEVSEEPERLEGGHTVFEISDEEETIEVIAFEPTKHFRNKVDKLRVGDTVTICGEITDGTLKLEKFNLHNLRNYTLENPICPGCENTMKSAGRNAGYRCRSCGTSRGSKEKVPLQREIDTGWHEVPPCARRHIAMPLIRKKTQDKKHPYK